MALFDRADAAPVAQRRLALAAAFLPNTAEPASLGVGDAERLFWLAKRAHFGPKAPAQFPCDGCDEPIGFAVPEGFDLPAQIGPTAQVVHNGQTYQIACPTLSDLGVTGLASLAPDAPWDDPVFRAKAAEALDAADPAMDVIFDVACVACGTENPRAFDAAAFLWADLDAFAAGVFAEVAILARAFGWSEAETLALSPARRARYIGLVA